MPEQVVGQELVAVEATEQEWRVVAACIAACAAGASQYMADGDERELARLWTRVHPDGFA